MDFGAVTSVWFAMAGSTEEVYRKVGRMNVLSMFCIQNVGTVSYLTYMAVRKYIEK